MSALQKGLDPIQREEREAEWAIADSNHDVLLAVPEVLPQLVRILHVSGAFRSILCQRWTFIRCSDL